VLIELDPVERITADAVGPPGERTFYIQARRQDHLVTILVEKQQVQLLAASIVEILARVGKETGQGPPEEAMALEEPILPEWRAGRLSIGYQDERDLVVLEAEELIPEAEAEDEEEGEEGEEAGGDEDEEPPAEPEEREPERVRFWATREQMLSLARHGAAVCAQGRPQCPLCGNPLDPDGHICPALNGHRQSSDE
jgi:uncharacterized repeat protein (TIGR03847 family)